MSGFSILGDGILLFVSLVACIYCILLSRRVRRLASADQGLGKGIADMTQAVEKLNASLEQTRLAARNESDTLERQLAEARTLSGRAGELLDEGEHQLEDLDKGIAQARQLVTSLEGLVEAANKRRLRQSRFPDTAPWQEELADGLPGGDGDQPAPAPPQARRRERPRDEEALLLTPSLRETPTGLPVDAEDDPLPDVAPLPRRRTGRRSATPRQET